MKARRHLGFLILILAGAANAFGQSAGGRGLHRLSWPGKDWSVDVALAPFSVIMEESRKDDAGYFLVATLNNDNPAAGRILMLTVRLEAAKVKGSDTDFRDAAIKKLRKSEGVEGGSVKAFEYKQIPALRFSRANSLIQPYFPYPLRHGSSARGIEAFFVRDDVWVTFALNALLLKKADEQLLYAVLDSVKFTNTSTPASSFDYFYRAKTLIRQKQYAQAAADLDTALGLEQKQRQLDDAHWRNMIGYLVDIHTAAGDKTRVRELLDYGISNDPTFPLFHLALAILHASLGDVDNSIAALEKAYLYRKNDRRTAGFSWIDPLSHPAFEPFRKNEKFRKAAKAMKR